MQFGLLNAGKRSLSIDLKNEDGRRLFTELAKTADVVVQNYAPGTFDRLVGIGALLEANPRLIIAAGSGYGSTGPYCALRAMDLTIQAMSGVMATTGFTDGPPVRTGPSVVDFIGGAHLAAAVLAALVQRAVTGRGQHVEVALYDAIFPALASNIGGYFDSDGEIPERTGNRHGGLGVSPYNVYPTADGWIAILCLHDRYWRALCETMRRPELTDKPSLSSNVARTAALDRVDAIVGAWAGDLPTADIFSALHDAGAVRAGENAAGRDHRSPGHRPRAARAPHQPRAGLVDARQPAPPRRLTAARPQRAPGAWRAQRADPRQPAGPGRRGDRGPRDRRGHRDRRRASRPRSRRDLPELPRLRRHR